MKSVVLKSPEKLEYMDIPKPELSDENHVLIRVGACGICGSDLRYYKGENPWALHTLGVHVENPPNIVMGHEFSGTVVKVNSKKYENLLGKRVGAQAFRVCYECDFCESGKENLCPNMIHLGHAQGWGDMDFYPGAYGEYSLAWGDLCYPISADISFEEAAMADILCVAVHVFNRVSSSNRARVLCIGGGPAGLSIAQVAQCYGTEEIYISDPSETCRSIVNMYEGFHAFDSKKGNLFEFVMDKSVGKKCNAIFDSVGSNETFNLAMSLLEESGTYVNMAVHKTEIKFNAMAMSSERTITTSSNAHYNDVKTAYDLINSGRISVKPWITNHFSLSEFRDAFDLLLAPEKKAFKVVFNDN